MRNRPEIHRNNLDLIIGEMSDEDIRTLIFDFSDLERRGHIGDCLLRKTAGDIYRKLQGRSGGFDAVYMTLVGHAAHKALSARAIEAEHDLDDGPESVARALSRLDPNDSSACAALVSRARSLFPDEDEPYYRNDGPA